MYEMTKTPQDIEATLNVPGFVEIGFFDCPLPFDRFNTLSEFEKMELRLILEYLNRNNWCQAYTAKALGINPRQLYTKLQRWGIRCKFWRKHIPRNGK